MAMKTRNPVRNLLKLNSPKKRQMGMARRTPCHESFIDMRVWPWVVVVVVVVGGGGVVGAFIIMRGLKGCQPSIMR